MSQSVSFCRSVAFMTVPFAAQVFRTSRRGGVGADLSAAIARAAAEGLIRHLGAIVRFNFQTAQAPVLVSQDVADPDNGVPRRIGDKPERVE
jgi:hypothetical protein